jgi:hypothetical protein
MRRFWERGAYDCYGLFDGEEILGYAFFVRLGNNYLFDYLAIAEEHRDEGPGTLFLRQLAHCLQDADHAVPVLSIVLPGQAEVQPCRDIPGLPSDWVGLRTEGLADETDGPLYGTQPPVRTPCRVTAIPYFAWANRQAGNMTVWIRETDTGHT